MSEPTKTPAELWVEALRSGEFVQGRGRLARKSEDQWHYCCFGVACELYQRHVGGLDVTQEGATRRFNDMGGSLPVEVRGWLGVRNMLGTYEETSLAARNDLGATFAEIADIIESRPPGLFIE